MALLTFVSLAHHSRLQLHGNQFYYMPNLINLIFKGSATIKICLEVCKIQ